MNEPCREPVPGDRVPCERVPGEREPAGPAVKLREAASDDRALPPPGMVPRGKASSDFVRGLAAPIFREWASIDLHCAQMIVDTNVHVPLTSYKEFSTNLEFDFLNDSGVVAWALPSALSKCVQSPWECC